MLLLLLGCLGTGVAYIMNFNVVREAGVPNASLPCNVRHVSATRQSSTARP